MSSRRTHRGHRLAPIKTILQLGSKRTQEAMDMSKLQRKWESVVGPLLFSQTKPKRSERGVLWVSVDNSALLYELSHSRMTILDKIEGAIGIRFKNIKFTHEEVLTSDSSTEIMPGKKFERVLSEDHETLESILGRVRSMSSELRKGSFKK